MTGQEFKDEVHSVIYGIYYDRVTAKESIDKILSLLTADTLLTLLKEKTGYSIIQLDRPQAVCKDCDKIWHECECPVKIYVKEDEIKS